MTPDVLGELLDQLITHTDRNPSLAGLFVELYEPDGAGETHLGTHSSPLRLVADLRNHMEVIDLLHDDGAVPVNIGKLSRVEVRRG